MNSVPFAIPDLAGREQQLLLETLASGWITQGPRVLEFEAAVARAVDASHAVAVSSCTAALHLALLAAGVKEGDEVILPTHTFIATANAVVHAGASPVFADIDPATLNLDPAAAEAAITPRTSAILCVHQIGHPAELDDLQLICSKHGLLLIEDAACAIGSRYRDSKIGSNSHSPLVAFSFHPRKVLTTGDGGIITTNDPAIDRRLRLLRQHGMSVNDLARHKSGRFVPEAYLEVGYNYRMTDLQACLGVAQAERLDEIVAARRAAAALYDQALAAVPGVTTFIEPAHHFWNRQTYFVRVHGFPSGPDTRDALIDSLLKHGISTRRGITSIHREPAYSGHPLPHPLRQSESASDECIALPLFPRITSDQIAYVVEKLCLELAQIDHRRIECE